MDILEVCVVSDVHHNILGTLRAHPRALPFVLTHELCRTLPPFYARADRSQIANYRARREREIYLAHMRFERRPGSDGRPEQV